MKTSKLTMGLLTLIGAMALITPSFAATTSNNTVNFRAVVSPTLTATCDGATAGSPVDLGTFDAGATPSATAVNCSVTQNRRTGTLSITASPAANSMNLTASGGSDTIAVNFAGYSFSTGTINSGTFAAGISVTNPARGASTFSYNATPAAISSSQAADTYTGSHTLTFSLI